MRAHPALLVVAHEAFFAVVVVVARVSSIHPSGCAHSKVAHHSGNRRALLVGLAGRSTLLDLTETKTEVDLIIELRKDESDGTRAFDIEAKDVDLEASSDPNAPSSGAVCEEIESGVDFCDVIEVDDGVDVLVHVGGQTVEKSSEA